MGSRQATARVFRILILPTSELARISGTPRIWHPATSEQAQWTAASSIHKSQGVATNQGPDYADKPTKPPTESAHHSSTTLAALLGGTPRAYSLGDERGIHRWDT